MDPCLAERMATVRRSELAALAAADHAARRHRRARRAQAVGAEEAGRAWRLAVARRLVSAGLRLGLPPERRPLARHGRAWGGAPRSGGGRGRGSARGAEGAEDRDATALLGGEDLTAC